MSGGRKIAIPGGGGELHWKAGGVEKHRLKLLPLKQNFLAQANIAMYGHSTGGIYLVLNAYVL